MDYNNQSDFSDENTIIYGHHMKDGSMFATITKYKEQEYYDKHKKMYLFTPDGKYRVDLFAGFVADDKDEDVWRLGFSSEEEKADWITKLQNRSCFQSETKLGKKDKILMYSTCSYEFENARFVLYGRMKKVKK